MAINKTILALALVGLLIGQATSDILPTPACLVLEFAFQILGCINGDQESTECKVLGLVLRLELDGAGLCDKEPCSGYGSPEGRSCTNLFPRQCDAENRVENGICSFGTECCNSTSNILSTRFQFPSFT